MNTPKELREKYPYQFMGPNIGFGFYKGWLSIVVRVCSDIDQLLAPDKHGFHWVQIKEKFGTIRMYWEWDRDATNSPVEKDTDDALGLNKSIDQCEHDRRSKISAQLHALVDAAEAETYHVCIVCGARGNQTNFSGHIQTLCPEHAKMKRAGKLPPASFPDDGEDDDAAH